MEPQFAPELRARCIDLFVIDPEVSYREMLLEIHVGGPVLARIIDALWDVNMRPLLLADSEREALACLAFGLSQQEAADNLGRSFHTLAFQARSASRKLGTRTRTQAVAEAIRLGLLTDWTPGTLKDAA